MKKLLLAIIGVIFMITCYSQSFIGLTKKEVLNDLKDKALKIEKLDKDEQGFYSVRIQFQNNKALYSFTKDDLCYFYIITEKFYADNYSKCVEYYDDRYLRVYDNKTDIWKEPKGETFVYRWIICNLNDRVQYTLFLTKDNYDKNRYTYIQQLLGSH